MLLTALLDVLSAMRRMFERAEERVTDLWAGRT